jgi:hypothetical protein
MKNSTMTMKIGSSLLLVLLCVIPLVAPQASGAERMRIIVDTDIENEMDDQHALAYTLLNGHVFEVEGVTTNSKHQWEVQPFEREALADCPFVREHGSGSRRRIHDLRSNHRRHPQVNV